MKLEISVYVQCHVIAIDFEVCKSSVVQCRMNVPLCHCMHM